MIHDFLTKCGLRSKTRLCQAAARGSVKTIPLQRTTVFCFFVCVFIIKETECFDDKHTNKKAKNSRSVKRNCLHTTAGGCLTKTCF